MSTVVKTANGHQTSLLIRQHIPEFVVSDHPQFVTFIEKYYEFMANNTLMATSANSDVYYYGADTAAKILQDIRDVDKTDFDQFVEKFRRQYGFSFPQSLYSETNRATLYKNMVDFYQAVGTEDSFKMLFRLLYNEEIEIYYPKTDLLIASGGHYTKQSRIKVFYTENLNDIENKIIKGAFSGAYGTVERVEAVPIGVNSFVSGQVAKTDLDFAVNSGDFEANNTIIEQMKLLEDGGRPFAFVYLTNHHGIFKAYEEVGYYEGGAANTTVAANTCILPMLEGVSLQDDFKTYSGANNFVSLEMPYINPRSQRAYSTNPPWGSANVVFVSDANGSFSSWYGEHIYAANLGYWHTTGGGTGEIKFSSNNRYNTVLEVGNNSVSTSNGDLRHFVYTRPIPVDLDNGVYRLTIRARDLGGNSAYSVAGGNRFSCGVIPLRADFRVIGTDGYLTPNAAHDTFDNPYWIVSHEQALDDSFFSYDGFFHGRVRERPQVGYQQSNYGNGGRKDLPTGPQNYNSFERAINNEVRLPQETAYVIPTFKVNEPSSDAAFSQGITQIDSIRMDKITTVQIQRGGSYGSYRNESSLLSGSSYLQDGHYRQLYSYDIRSKQQLEDYATVVRESVHPTGFKMFGTKITESSTNASYSSSMNNLEDIFSPNQLSSLSGWWKADAISPLNIEYKKWSSDITPNTGVFGTDTNILTFGSSDFESPGTDYSQMAEGGLSVDGVTISPLATTESPTGGPNVLKVVDEHTQAAPELWLNNPSASFSGNKSRNNRDYEDGDFNIVISPEKQEWIFSVYVATNNTNCDSPNDNPRNSFSVLLNFANTSGYLESKFADTGNHANIISTHTWERKALRFGTTDDQDGTRAVLSLRFPDRTSFSESTGNTYYLLDGFMLEKYDETIHGAAAPYTPSPYLRPGKNGANVISWFDQSPNKHHVYANTAGGFYTPQLVTNILNGKPAIRFSANTVKNDGNVYAFSSIGGTSNSIALKYGDATNFKPPTSGLQSKVTSNSSGGHMGGTLASNSLPRPVANSWTIMAVVKSNLAINSMSYDTTLHPTIFNSGYAGNEDALSDSGSAAGTLNLGYDVVGETGAVQVNVVNSTAGLQSMNTSAVATFGGLSSPNTASSFRIVGVSVNASSLDASSTEDLLNFHINGRRFANSEINNFGVSGFTGAYNFSQNNYVTSIGKWRPGNSFVTTSDPVASVYEYGAADWDGDIAEILVFNEKLSNSNIAKVEGYLAHKYGLEDDLVYKDDVAEVEAYRWDFANTSGGWKFSSTGGATTSTVFTNDGIQIISGSGSSVEQSMEINLPTPYDGNVYRRFKIRFKNTAPTSGSVSTETYKLYFNNPAADAVVGAGNFKSVYGPSGNFTPDSTGNWQEETKDISTTQYTYLDLANPKGNRIKKLKIVFNTTTGGTQKHEIDYISISSGGIPSHPYANTPPSTISGVGTELGIGTENY